MIIKDLESEDQLKELHEKSFSEPVVIFKHSTRCAISSMVFSRLRRSWDGVVAEDQDLYYLDLIRYRDTSAAIASKYSVAHESPQLLIIKDGMCTFNASHNAINVEDIKVNT